MVKRLEAGDVATARFVGLPLDLLVVRPSGPVDAGTIELLRPLVEKAALVQSINDAWALVAGLTLAALICDPFATNHLNRRPTRSDLR